MNNLDMIANALGWSEGKTFIEHTEGELTSAITGLGREGVRCAIYHEGQAIWSTNLKKYSVDNAKALGKLMETAIKLAKGDVDKLLQILEV